MTSPTAVIPVAAPTRMDPDEAAEVREAILRVLSDGPWIGGPVVGRFEQEFAAASGVRHVVGTGNGSDALGIAMAALELPPASGVLVAANDGGYSAAAASALGLVPVVMDVDATTMAPTADLAERAWRGDVSAIVVTHLHGDPVALPELDAWRRDRGIRLIEDCAQAHGASSGSRRVGTTGDAATFSFYPTKNLGAVGDAGAAGFADERAAARARELAQYGWGQRYRVDRPRGRNSRLDPIQAAVLSARLPRLERRNARRRAISDRYRAALIGSGARLAGDPSTTVAHHAVLIADDRDGVVDLLRGRGVGTDIHYPFLLQQMPGLDVPPAVTPNAATLRDRIVTLPCFPELRDDEVDAVCAALATIGRRP